MTFKLFTLCEWCIIFLQGQGGNSNTGATARKFFYTEELRNRVLDWVPEEHREPLRILMSNTSVLLRLMDSDLEVNVERVADLCLDTYIHLAENFGKGDTRKLDFYPTNLLLYKMISNQFQNIFIFAPEKTNKRIMLKSCD